MNQYWGPQDVTHSRWKTVAGRFDQIWRDEGTFKGFDCTDKILVCWNWHIYGGTLLELRTMHVHRLGAVITLSSNKCTLDLDCFVDSDRAGRQQTRKNSSGVVVVVNLLNRPVKTFCTRTQGTIALSSGEAELYAIGQQISDTLRVRNLILDAELAN